jgi:hypothetical protein
VYESHGAPSQTDDIGSFSFADYSNVSYGFVLANGESEQDQDRVMDILLHAPPSDPWTMEEATQIALGLLPSDAVSVGSMRTYTIEGIFWDYRQQFHSEDLADVIPGDGQIYCAEDPDEREKSGTVWIKLNPDSDGSTRIKDIQVTTQGCG